MAGSAPSGALSGLGRTPNELVDCLCGDSHPPGDYGGVVCAACTGSPMIRCDGATCLRWYHLECLGLEDVDIPFGDYACPRCAPKPPASRAGRLAAAAAAAAAEAAADDTGARASDGIPAPALHTLLQRARLLGVRVRAARAAQTASAGAVPPAPSHPPPPSVAGDVAASPAGAAVAALPADLLGTVLSYLALPDLLRAGGVNAAWRAAARSPPLWRRVSLWDVSERVDDVGAVAALLASGVLSRGTRSVDLGCCAALGEGTVTALVAAAANGGGAGLATTSLSALCVAFCPVATDRWLRKATAGGVGAAPSHVVAAPKTPIRSSSRKRSRPTTDAEEAGGAAAVAPSPCVPLPVSERLWLGGLTCLDVAGTPLARSAVTAPGVLQRLSDAAPRLGHLNISYPLWGQRGAETLEEDAAAMSAAVFRAIRLIAEGQRAASDGGGDDGASNLSRPLFPRLTLLLATALSEAGAAPGGDMAQLVTTLFVLPGGAASCAPLPPQPLAPARCDQLAALALAQALCSGEGSAAQAAVDGIFGGGWVLAARSDDLASVGSRAVPRRAIDAVLAAGTARCGCTLGGRSGCGSGLRAPPPTAVAAIDALAALVVPPRAANDSPIGWAALAFRQDPEDRGCGREVELATRGVRIVPRVDSAWRCDAMGPHASASAAASSPPGAHAPPTTPDEVTTLVRSALRLSNSADTLLASIAAVNSALAAAPSASLHLFAAALSDRVYRWEDALRHTSAALQLAPDCGTAALQLAGSLMQRGDPGARDAAGGSSVEGWLDAAEASASFVCGTVHDVWEERGVLLLRQGRRRAASACLRLALHYAPWTCYRGDAGIARRLQVLAEGAAAAAAAARRDGAGQGGTAGWMKGARG